MKKILIGKKNSSWIDITLYQAIYTGMHPKPKAVIFDMDGVIISTCSLHETAWRNAGALLGYTWPQEIGFKKNVFGSVSEHSAKILFGDHLTADATERLITVKDREYEELLGERIKDIEVPGIRTFLACLRANNLRLAVATSARKEEAEFVLNSLSLIDNFEVIVDISHIKKAKPDPEIYLRVLSKLNLPASQCIAFEDSVFGVKAVIEAGIHCILVKTTMDDSKLALHNLACYHSINNFQAEELAPVWHLFDQKIADFNNSWDINR